MPRIGRYPIPQDPAVERLSTAVDRLRVKLLALDTHALEISDYSKKYLRGTLVNGVSKLNLYAFLILLSLRASARNEDRHVSGILDYGGGNGLLSLLAREAGFPLVVYSDIDAGSSRDAQRIAAALDLQADHYVVGDLPETVEYLRTNDLNCQAMCSYDVIEHVYDIDAFLRNVANIANGPLSVVMGSGANGANPRIRRKLMADQRQVEHEDRSPEWGHKQRDTTTAYARIREQLIQGVAPELGSDRLSMLVARTRGMDQRDIEAAATRFIQSGLLPPVPDHPTNTCDPMTGNWAEHLMYPTHLAGVLACRRLSRARRIWLLQSVPRVERRDRMGSQQAIKLDGTPWPPARPVLRAGRRPGRRLATLHSRRDRPRQDLDVQPERPAVDVFEVGGDPAIELRLAARPDLPQAGDPRLHRQPAGGARGRSRPPRRGAAAAGRRGSSRRAAR